MLRQDIAVSSQTNDAGSGCELHNSGALLLAEALMDNKALRGIYLPDNGIEGEGAEALANVLEVNFTLTYLDLTGNPCEVNAPEIMEKIRACLTRNQAQAGFGDGANSQSESVSNASLATSSTLYPHASATSWTSKDGGPARDQSPPRRVLQTGNPESCSIGK
ncbi:hypothetical protein ABBQ32_003432 [Trebouxia sp. C0010 RCD-2024]